MEPARGVVASPMTHGAVRTSVLAAASLVAACMSGDDEYRGDGTVDDRPPDRVLYHSNWCDPANPPATYDAFPGTG